MAYYFSLPTFNDLTDNQKLSLQETDSIALSGGPGTGKTVVSLWRHIRNYELEPKTKSLLLTYTKTLEYYLRNTARLNNDDAGDNIDRTLNWVNRRNKERYDEIIIDEAQDVLIDNYSIISNYTDKVSYGADEAQSVYCPNCCTVKQLNAKYGDNEPYELSKNFRNSKEILQFTKSVFPDISIPINVLNNSRISGRLPNPLILGWDDFESKVVDTILDIANEFDAVTHNIGVLVPGVKQVDNYYDLISARGLTCSKYHYRMNDFETLERIHVTTFKSSKGLEFDTVVIPGFDSYQWFIDNTKGQFTENDYYVALTRAKLNLYLLCKNSL